MRSGFTKSVSFFHSYSLLWFWVFTMEDVVILSLFHCELIQLDSFTVTLCGLRRQRSTWGQLTISFRYVLRWKEFRSSCGFPNPVSWLRQNAPCWLPGLVCKLSPEHTFTQGVGSCRKVLVACYHFSSTSPLRKTSEIFLHVGAKPKNPHFWLQ